MGKSSERKESGVRGAQSCAYSLVMRMQRPYEMIDAVNVVGSHSFVTIARRT
jgi:predicted peroxiredoxin